MTTDGPIFRKDGEPWRYKGVTAFKLCELFRRGEDIDGFLSDFAGYNVLRVFSYTPAKEWGAEAWEPPDPAIARAFCAFVAARGFFVELVLLTDDDPARIEPAKDLVRRLALERTANVLIEVGNEPMTHKTIDTHALQSTLAETPFLCSSGDNEDSRRWWGSYLTAHTGRDSEWPRRAHDLFDYYKGGGPSFPEEPAIKAPIVADEPIRPDQAQGDRDRDFLAYFGACSLLGAGATFHFESGKHGQRPTDDEKRLAAIALHGLNAFPADAPKGPYRRLSAVEDPHSLRTYVVGNHMVRVRPETPDAPEPGWRALDSGGVLWQR